MTLSNKILLGLVLFAFAYLNIAFIDIRINGENTDFESGNSVSEDIALPSFKYIVMKGLDRRLFVKQSDEFGITVRSAEGDKSQMLDYHVSNDTLFVNSLEIDEDEHIDLYVYVDGLEGFTSLEGYATISDCDSDVLKVNLNNGNVTLLNNDIRYLEVIGVNDSRLNSDRLRVDSLSVSVDNTLVRLDAELIKLEGKMTGESTVAVQGAEEIAIKKDRSSRIRVQ